MLQKLCIFAVLVAAIRSQADGASIESNAVTPTTEDVSRQSRWNETVSMLRYRLFSKSVPV